MSVTGVSSPKHTRALSAESADETTILSPASTQINYQTGGGGSNGIGPSGITQEHSQNLENVSRRRAGFGARLGGGAEGERVAVPREGLEEEEEDHKGEKGGFLERVVAAFRPLELENKGSVARDHLAIERTFLAWLRTSLAFASIGIAVTQLFRLNTSFREEGQSSIDPRLTRIRHIGKPLGATFLGLSIVMLLLGYQRYSMATSYVIKGKFPASRATILLVAMATFGLMLMSLAVVILVHPKLKKA